MASVASTYSRAFADVVLSAHLDVNRALSDLRAIASLVAESSDLRRVWENPAIAADQKRRVLDVIAERDGISKQARNLVAVLIDHRRIHFLDPVIRQLEKELDARLGFAEAEITTVRELADTERREFEAQESGEAYRQESPRPLHPGDASLLGGAVVRVRGQHDL